MKLIIGNKNYSSWSMRPWLLMRHFEIEFEEVSISLFTDGYEEELAQYTDAGKVPVLHDGELVVWDSLAICEYVSELHLQGRGWPEDGALRAEARSASAEMHSSFLAIRENMPMNCRARRQVNFTSEMKAEIKRVDALWQKLRGRYANQGDWLFGEFSIADCMYAPMASRFRTYAPEISDTSRAYVEQILEHPAVADWYDQAADEEAVIVSSEVGDTVSPGELDD